MSTTPTPEAPSPELLRMHNAGQLLANCAFNIAQHAGKPISESVAATLKQCQNEWDAACLAFKTARAALTQGAGAGDLANEIWAAAQLTPGEGVEDGAARVQALLSRGAGEAVEPVATVVSWTNSSYSRNYKLTWHKDVPEGAKLYAAPPAQQLQQAVARAIEECALIADRYAMALDDGNNPYLRSRECQQAAAAIRAKGTHD